MALAALLGAVTLVGIGGEAAAVEIADVGDETLRIDISNTSTIAYRFDNRNSRSESQRLRPERRVDDNYGEWLNRLYLRNYYGDFSLGVRLDSAIYFNTMTRLQAQQLVVEELGRPNLDRENGFGRELHSRFTNLIFPSKLWLGYKHKWLQVTVGDFYAQLGRGLVFSVRKLDEVGLDTTVRGAKVRINTKVEDWRVQATVFGGQLNPMRIDFPTGRILHGNGSPLFFGFPETQDFQLYSALGADKFQLVTERAKPSYLEDSVVGGNVTFGPKPIKFEFNTAVLLRSGDSRAQVACTEMDNADVDRCRAEFPAFSSTDASRSHNRVANFSAAIRVPTIDNIIDGYIEVAGQQHAAGRYQTLTPVEQREDDLWGYAVYANVNINAGPLAFTLEGKHYRRFFPLNANIDLVTPGFGAGEYNLVTYSQPPSTESIYVQYIGAPNLCITGGRARADLTLHDASKVYGWVGHYSSWTEKDATNNNCESKTAPTEADPTPADDNLRTDTWDTAAGGELNLQKGKTHYWAWVGARMTNRAVAEQVSPEIPGLTTAFYREGYVRYDFQQDLGGDFSLTMYGNHRRRFEPDLQAEPWNVGENLMALNYNPHWTFVFGFEYTTQADFPNYYFNGSIQWRAKNNDKWWGQVFDSARLFVGQRRSALRCVGGVCRTFPAFEGGRLEIVSRF